MYTELSSSHQPVTSSWNLPRMGAASRNHGKHCILYTVSYTLSALEASFFCPALPRTPRVRDTRPTHSGRFGKTKLSHKAHWAGRRLRGVPGGALHFGSRGDTLFSFFYFLLFHPFIHSRVHALIHSILLPRIASVSHRRIVWTAGHVSSPS